LVLPVVARADALKAAERERAALHDEIARLLSPRLSELCRIEEVIRQLR
jgi:hypothetical protein